MIPLDECQRLLLQIISLLDCGGDQDFAAAVRAELDGSVESLRSFLISNELWGGSGSLADSAFANTSANHRAEFERLMIDLGRVQIAAGCVNVRTPMWVEAFEHWRDKGIR